MRFEDHVQALLHDYESDQQAFRKDVRNAKTADERKASQRTHRVRTPRSTPGHSCKWPRPIPGTPAAEEALIWIVKNLPYGSMAERAKEMIARDHSRSEKIEPVFNNIQILMPGSKATERMFREALVQSPHRRIQGKEFADLPLANTSNDRVQPGRPTNLGAAAQISLHKLKHVGIGQPAPEIEGVDLDGKPMTLSKYRGKVVAFISAKSGS